jgi:hypothetical protein
VTRLGAAHVIIEAMHGGNVVKRVSLATAVTEVAALLPIARQTIRGDHRDMLAAGIRQVPAAIRRKILVRTDGGRPAAFRWRPR